uniref:KIB1-4 beta-propeller domain-containing protein n=1 Tax=Aegilops tauschii TaxID=37682 RepID=M8BGQ4_AEGTA
MSPLSLHLPKIESQGLGSNERRMSPSRSRKRPSGPQPTTALAKKWHCPAPAVLASDDVAGAAAPSSPSSSSWASLPGDMVRQIAWRVLAGDFLDYVRLRAVCTSWRSGTVCPRGRGVTDPRFHPRRWMMLPEGHGLYPGHRKLGGYIRFFNLDAGALARVELPLFKNHCALESVDGLLLLQRDQDTAIRLVHPFTRDIVELPPLATLLTQLGDDLRSAHTDPELRKWYYIRYCVCASVSCSGGSVVVMLAFRRLMCVAFATSDSQDQQWTMPSWEVPFNIAPLAFQGRLYFVHHPTTNGSLVFQINPPLQVGSPPLPPKLIATCPADKLYRGSHLVECNSQILLVGHGDISLKHIVIYKLEDLILERFIPVTSIGDRALFLQGKCLSVSSTALPTVMSETVVYTHPIYYHYAQYHLRTGAWSQPIDTCGLNGFNPGPRSLIHHVITCCIRNVWNKGLLYSKRLENRLPTLLWKVKRKLRYWVNFTRI